jgi:hypothetical protein
MNISFDVMTMIVIMIMTMIEMMVVTMIDMMTVDIDVMQYQISASLYLLDCFLHLAVYSG